MYLFIGVLVSSALYGHEDVWSYSEASTTPFVWGTTSTTVTIATTAVTVMSQAEEHVSSFHDNEQEKNFVIASNDTIDTVLDRLSLADHLPVFKVCLTTLLHVCMCVCVYVGMCVYRYCMYVCVYMGMYMCTVCMHVCM